MVLRNTLSVVTAIGFSRLREAIMAVAAMMMTIAAPMRRMSRLRESFQGMIEIRGRSDVRILLVFVLMVGCRREAPPPIPVETPTSPPPPAIPSVNGPKLMPVDEGSQD